MVKHLNPSGQVPFSAIKTAVQSFIGKRQRKNETVNVFVKTAERLLKQQEQTSNIAVTLAERKQAEKDKKSAVQNKRSKKSHKESCLPQVPVLGT